MSYAVEQDVNGSGFKVKGTVSMDVSKYDLLTLIGTGQWRSANVLGWLMPVIGMATEDINANRRGTILLDGIIHNNAWSWTPGALVYASTTDGKMTQTAPLGLLNMIQEVGMAISATLLRFNPTRGGNIVSFVPLGSADKIYDITHADTNAHTVVLPAGYPGNTVALIISVLRTGTGNLLIRPSLLGTNIFLGQNGWGLWLRSTVDGLFHYSLGTANDDWDVYAVGYITA